MPCSSHQKPRLSSSVRRRLCLDTSEMVAFATSTSAVEASAQHIDFLRPTSMSSKSAKLRGKRHVDL